MKVLIIEDEESDYQRLITVLNRYDLDYYPKKDQFKEFAMLLSQFARKKKDTDEIFGKIKNKIQEYDPDFVFLDKSLRFNQKADKTGLEIKDRILDIYVPKAQVCIITVETVSLGLSSLQDDVISIRKGSSVGLAAEVESKFIKRFNIGLKPDDIKGQVVLKEPAETVAAQSAISEAKHKDLPNGAAEGLEKVETANTAQKDKPVRYATDFPLQFEKNNQFLIYKILPWFQSAVDYFITLVFFTLIVFQFYKGGITLYEHSVHGEFKPILAAESAFITFLPSLIIFGFYVFYVHALRQYVMKTPSTTLDFESSGKLLTLTKKMFIISLISYLFTKIVELLEAGYKESYNFSFVNQAGIDLLFKVGLLLIIIILLVLFYMFLSNHKEHDSAPH